MKGEKLTQSREQRNYGVLRSWFPRWTWNTAFNFNKVREEFLQKKSTALFRHENKHKGEPAVIVGSGPSLDKTVPFLKDWKGAVFSTASNAKNCVRWGHKPDYVCLFDANRPADYHLTGVHWNGSTMVTHPATDTTAIASWKQKKIYYCMMHVSNVDYNELKPNMTLNEVVKVIKDQTFGSDFFEEINPILFPFIETLILNAGCTVNNAVQVAHFMGYDPLFLIGVDFGFPDDKLRCMRYDYKPLLQRLLWETVGHLAKAGEYIYSADFWQKFQNKEWNQFDAPTMETIGRVLHTSDNGILTTEEQITYKWALFSVYKIDKPQLFDCSDGIITELHKPIFEEVVKNGGKGYEKQYRTNEEIEQISNEVLARYKNFSDAGNGNRTRTEVSNQTG